MQVVLAPEQQDYVRRAIESGRFKCAENTAQEVLGLWVERGRRRAEILPAVDSAQASIDGGEGIETTRQSMRDLADVKRRGCARLAANQTATR